MHGVLKINWLDYKRVKSNFAENGKYIWTKKKKGKNAETRDNSEHITVLRIWTRDLQIFSLTLSQLSYLGM